MLQKHRDTHGSCTLSIITFKGRCDRIPPDLSLSPQPLQRRLSSSIEVRCLQRALLACGPTYATSVPIPGSKYDRVCQSVPFRTDRSSISYLVLTELCQQKLGHRKHEVHKTGFWSSSAIICDPQSFLLFQGRKGNPKPNFLVRIFRMWWGSST